MAIILFSLLFAGEPKSFRYYTRLRLCTLGAVRTLIDKRYERTMDGRRVQRREGSDEIAQAASSLHCVCDIILFFAGAFLFAESHVLSVRRGYVQVLLSATASVCPPNILSLCSCPAGSALHIPGLYLCRFLCVMSGVH